MRAREIPTADTATSSRSRDITPMPGDIGRLDGELREYHKRREPAFGKFARVTTLATLGAVTAGAVWLAGNVLEGMHDEREAVQSSHAMIHDIYTNTDELDVLRQHHGTFVLTGLGTKNPTETAEILTVHREIGQVFALEYSNKDLDTKDMARRVIATAREHELTELSFDGYSAGGPIALDIAAHIRELEPDINIVAIVFNSSPIGEHSLTQKSQEGIDLMQTILSINENFAYYRNGHIVTELLASNEQYLERHPTASRNFTLHSYNSFDYNGTSYRVLYPEILPQLYRIIDKLSDDDAASAMLIWAQAKFIVQTDYSNNLTKLDNNTIIFYTRALHADDDTVVATDPSAANLATAARDTELEFHLLTDKVRHANPAEDTAAYTRMLRTAQTHIHNHLIKIVLPREMAKQSLIPLVTPVDPAHIEAAPIPAPR